MSNLKSELEKEYRKQCTFWKQEKRFCSIHQEMFDKQTNLLSKIVEIIKEKCICPCREDILKALTGTEDKTNG